MKNAKQYMGSMLVLFAALSAFVWVAWAQDQGASSRCCGAGAEVLALTAEQEDTIEAIQAGARVKSLSALTDAPKAILGTVPAEPVVPGKAMAKACVEGCPRSCRTKVKAGSGDQTPCPMMDPSVMKALFLHHGKKVNFYCPGLTGHCTRNAEKPRLKSSQFNI